MALPESIGVPVGTVTPQDLKGHRRHFLFGQNVGTNSPRMLHDLQDAARRGVPIVCPTQDRILLRIALVDRRADAFWEWRRQLAGPSGCGLCGLESLAAAVPPPRRVTGDIRVSGDAIHRAMTILPERQRMNRLTGALHAAAFWTPTHGIVAVREDVGRHNALDQLTGAVIATALPAAAGAVLLTSRVSVEMVQKAASLGVPILVAVSAPTALALRAADAARITLIAVARHDGSETFTDPHRIQ